MRAPLSEHLSFGDRRRAIDLGRPLDSLEMASHTAKTFVKELRASFRRKKTVDPAAKNNTAKEAEEEELAKLVELKESLGDQLPPLYSDAALLGFLRARVLNVKEALKLVKTDENMKRILMHDDFQPPKMLSSYNFTGVIGFDSEGSLVRVINFGTADLKGLIQAISTIESLRILLWGIEKDCALIEAKNKCSRKRGRGVYILNMEHLSMSRLTYKPVFDTIVQALKLLQDHYHDMPKFIYVIHAPSFFSSVLKLLKPFIRDSLYKKIKILDHDNWKEELLKKIDVDLLPQSLGGNRVDSNGDPECRKIIPVCSVIPESLYASNFLDIDDPEVMRVNVPAGACLNFRYPVRQVGATLKWHIQAKENNIGLALFIEPFQSGSETPRIRKKRDEDMSRFEALTPIIRSQCHICPEEGAAILSCTGNVIIHFDNTYSWMNSKEVYVKLSVRSPTTGEQNAFNIAENISIELKKMAVSC